MEGAVGDIALDDDDNGVTESVDDANAMGKCLFVNTEYVCSKLSIFTHLFV